MTRKALLVGVNDYKEANDLRGCINDVLDMHFSLRSLFGFETRNIRVLTDSRATRQNILDRLEWLVDGAQAGDFLVFHFAGHGSQIRDRDEKDELEDHLDELICPYDMDWDGTFITDDQLNDVFQAVPEGVLLEVFLDCCHSGTGLREMGLEPPPGLAAEHPTLSRYLPPPTDVYLRFSCEEEYLDSQGFVKGFVERDVKHHILWAACMARQTAADAYINGRYHGAFTYYLNVHLRREPRVSRKELLRKVQASLRHGGFNQVPQLEVDATKRERIIFVDQEPAGI